MEIKAPGFSGYFHNNCRVSGLVRICSLCCMGPTTLKELSFPVSGPTRIHVDNNGCKSMSSNHRTDALTKHIDVKFHYTRDLVDENCIDIQYCPTNLMIADFLTKPIPARKFLWCRDALNIKDIRSRGDVGTD